MTRLLTYILTLLSLTSCTGLRLHKSEFQAIDKSFQGSFVNAPFKTKGRLPHNSLLRVFEVFPDKADTVHLKFNTAGQLVLTFDNSLGSATFDGKFKRGFYQIYIRRKNIQIPPLLPIFYSRRDIYRVRIALTKNHELVLDNKWAMDGSTFIMAAGASGRRQYQFKRTMTK